MNFLTFGLLSAHFLWCLMHLNGAFWIYLLIIVGYTIANIAKTSRFHNSFRRKMQIATWNDSGNPAVRGQVEMDMDTINEKLAPKGYTAKDRPPTAVILAKGFALAITSIRKPLGKLILGNFWALPNADVSFQIKIKKGRVGYFTIRAVDTKSLTELTKEYRAKEKELKEGRNSTQNLIEGLGLVLPQFLLQMVLQVLFWLATDVGLNMSAIGLPAHPFGVITVADIQETGLQDSFPPLNPLHKTLLVVNACKTEPKLVAFNDEVAVRNICHLNAVFDHRYADGADGAKLMRIYKDFVANLDKYLD